MDDDIIRRNLSNIYGIKQAPCDTWFRERLDEVNPEEIRKSFKAILSTVQRGKGLGGCPRMKIVARESEIELNFRPI
ncbi:MAG: hypothetical protein Q9M28_02305 [Mariprofundaceae bacterium]|nr:hypothetical protein [Mariprofundaceae bacterium]